jgi:uncharacterized protein GlcG (DUF336 family)
MANTKTLETLTLPGARIALAAAEAKATSMGLDMNIAIVDASTHLLAFSRMPNAKITSIGIAMDKAFTAAGYVFFPMKLEKCEGEGKRGVGE